MVEPMKKLNLLIMRSEADDFLVKLERLGLVHIENESFDDDKDLFHIQKQINAFQKTANLLKKHRRKKQRGKKETLPETKKFQENLDISTAEELFEASEKILHDDDHTLNEYENLLKEKEILTPWKGYHPDHLAELAQQGVFISFHILPRVIFSLIPLDSQHIEIVKEERNRLYFARIRHDRDDGEERNPSFPEEQLPQRSLEEIDTALVHLKNARIFLGEKIEILLGYVGLFEEKLKKLGEEYARVLARLSFQEKADGEVLCLAGYLPISAQKKAENFLSTHNILALFEKPDNPLETPVQLRNGKVARLFEPITKIFGLPFYGEIDSTPFFAPFFALFFGLCLADVGYGLLVAVSCGVMSLWGKKTALLRPVLFLGFILGLMSVLGGLFFNTLFGMKIDIFPNLPDAVGKVLFFKDINSAMTFSLFLGVCQILFGFILQVANRIKQGRGFSSLQAVGTFLILFGLVFFSIAILGKRFEIGPLALGAWIFFFSEPKKWGIFFIVLGIALVLFFNNTKKAFWLRPILGIWELYGIATTLPADILSYIRIFALSLAGGLLGGAINLIAVMVRGENPGIFSSFFMVLVLVTGHGINFALATLGAFVHSLRLTFVEFYRAVGFAGGGKKYKPFGGGVI